MTEAYVYDAVRTPFGRLGGALAQSRPDDLAAFAVRTLLERSPGLDPAAVAEVVLGNANGAGEENRNVGRMAVLLAGLPVSVPGSTVNRLCGSSLDAAMGASRMIETGDADVVVTGGVESMTRAPWVLPKPDKPLPDRQRHRGVDRARLAAGQPADAVRSGRSRSARPTSSSARSTASPGSGRTRSRCARTSWPTGPGPTGSTRTW